jgi:hypothetical protein
MRANARVQNNYKPILRRCGITAQPRMIWGAFSGSKAKSIAKVRKGGDESLMKISDHVFLVKNHTANG